MARIALLPDITLPRQLDDVRDCLHTSDGVDECAVLVPQSRTMDDTVLNAELAPRLQDAGPFDLVVAVGHTADAAVEGRGAARVVLIDPPLTSIVLRSQPLGSPGPRLPVSPDAEQGLAVIISEAEKEAETESDPLMLRLVDESTAFLRSLRPFEAPPPIDPIPSLQWVIDAREGADYLDIWLTPPAVDKLETAAREFPNGVDPAERPSSWPPPPPDPVDFPTLAAERQRWSRVQDWGGLWRWGEPQTAADAILGVVA